MARVLILISIFFSFDVYASKETCVAAYEKYLENCRASTAAPNCRQLQANCLSSCKTNPNVAVGNLEALHHRQCAMAGGSSLQLDTGMLATETSSQNPVIDQLNEKLEKAGASTMTSGPSAESGFDVSTPDRGLVLKYKKSIPVQPSPPPAAAK